MDRKAWIVVTLCVIGLGVNQWFSFKNQQAYAAQLALAEANKPKNTEAQPAVPGVATASTDGAATTTPTLSAAKPDAVAAATANLPEEKHSLVSGSVTYHFSSKGAGVAKAVLAAGDKITLNEVGRKTLEPIGALRREATGIDIVPYKIIEKSDKSVTFEGVSADGITIRKAYKLTEGEKSDEHLLALSITLTNTGSVPHKSEEYYLYTGAASSISPDEVLKPSFFWNDAGDADHKDTHSFAGGWFSQEKNEHRASHARLRYGGVMSRFYATIVSRVTPGGDKPGKIWATRFLVDHAGDKYAAYDSAKHDYGIESALSLPPVELAPGASVTEQYEIYLGPKEYHRLSKLEGQRDFIMFYGMFGWISKPLNTIMRWMHDVSGNWGVAIILLTLVIRTVLWPLQSKAQYSMKRMGMLAPKMKELQEKYKDDPQKQQMEVMKLYKDYGVNPVGGCLPMLMQIPIFFGFYSVLQNAAELRGQGWLWVKDLSISDTIYTFNFPFSLPIMGTDFDLNPLPLIMGVTMILQMKLTPQPATVDKSQKIMFAIMPFFFLFISYNFAAALSLYWSTQNLFAIFQSRVMKLYMKDPVLEKVEPKPKGAPSQNPFFNPMNPNQKEKKTKPKTPKLGG
ncbi:YidC/Oxa1 family insertase periplasmic-domain containing protein [Prosthecobacter dejongeii]|uniref:Membrane protein insertase YidC n=1 Tax=Prosthecobacter dejongeii TaxID=48465 RepID=A0A7W7YP76_9BACT|nr:YidC/Oxa1 family insertase periplasmic-domain containing protein [Prosthecobacter dejongeii]MBB5039793.1 YidC/Oxa1 family membrane protein insertase [Prosthecobacter dejongeii]